MRDRWELIRDDWMHREGVDVQVLYRAVWENIAADLKRTWPASPPAEPRTTEAC